MGIFTHWYVVVIILAIALLLLAPSVLPRLGRRLGQRMRETKDASVEAGKALRDEATRTTDGEAGSGSETEAVPPRT